MRTEKSSEVEKRRWSRTVDGSDPGGGTRWRGRTSAFHHLQGSNTCKSQQGSLRRRPRHATLVAACRVRYVSVENPTALGSDGLLSHSLAETDTGLITDWPDSRRDKLGLPAMGLLGFPRSGFYSAPDPQALKTNASEWHRLLISAVIR